MLLVLLMQMARKTLVLWTSFHFFFSNTIPTHHPLWYQLPLSLQYKSYKIPCTPGSSYSLSFSDVMGFEQNNGRGVCVADIVLALKGHIKEGYTVASFKPPAMFHVVCLKKKKKKFKVCNFFCLFFFASFLPHTLWLRIIRCTTSLPRRKTEFTSWFLSFRPTLQVCLLTRSWGPSGWKPVNWVKWQLPDICMDAIVSC